jgi:hypothetical protein
VHCVAIDRLPDDLPCLWLQWGSLETSDQDTASTEEEATRALKARRRSEDLCTDCSAHGQPAENIATCLIDLLWSNCSRRFARRRKHRHVLRGVWLEHPGLGTRTGKTKTEDRRQRNEKKAKESMKMLKRLARQCVYTVTRSDRSLQHVS